jgi:hypothetical protein
LPAALGSCYLDLVNSAPDIDFLGVSLNVLPVMGLGARGLHIGDSDSEISCRCRRQWAVLKSEKGIARVVAELLLVAGSSESSIGIQVKPVPVVRVSPEKVLVATPG